MILHLHPEAFKLLLSDISARVGLREDVLEKDYYVTLLLEELAGLQREGVKAYFKGGTALYKALGKTNRFSEDIDITVDVAGLSRTQADKLLAKVTKMYTSLRRDTAAGWTNRSEVVAEYSYHPVVAVDVDDALQRFGRVKVEATSFTVSEPVQPMTVSPLIYTFASDKQRRILELVYDVSAFSVATVTVGRIFIDKLFAAESYVRSSEQKHRAFDAAKHLYDIAVMINVPDVVDILGDCDKLEYLLSVRLREEAMRLDGVRDVKPSQFTLFSRVSRDTNVMAAFDEMQSKYVFSSADLFTFDGIVKILQELRAKLNSNKSWLLCPSASEWAERIGDSNCQPSESITRLDLFE